MQAWEEKALEREDGRAEGREEGRKEGRKEGSKEGTKEGVAQTLIKNVEAVRKNFKIDLRAACEGLGITVEEYEKAKEQIRSRSTR